MPQLILLVFLIFAAWLIKRDIARRPGISRAIWIPTLWLGILASRPLSTWIGIGGGSDTLDGSPVDRIFYLTLILAAMVTLSKRSVDWGWLVARNWPVLVFYSFLFISIAWTNSPFSSFKRWFKEAGNILIVLVILTEVNPLQAFRAVFVRCAYVLIPLSMIFIRYFPDLGRRYSKHTGEMMAVGVTFQKNSLGTMILACGLIFLWDWLERSNEAEGGRSQIDRYVAIGIGVLAIWLLYLCDSKTSIVAFMIAAMIVYSIKLPVLRRRISAFGTYTLLGVLIFFLVDQEIGIFEAIITSLGRDMTFTGRTEVWRILLDVGTDPLLGTGFMSFWDDPFFQSKLPEFVGPTAHNGYLEVYLAGGAIGVVALVLMLLGTMARINRALADGTGHSVVRFAILVLMLIANLTESNFALMTPLGFLFLLAAIGRASPDPFTTVLPATEDAFADIESDSAAKTS